MKVTIKDQEYEVKQMTKETIVDFVNLFNENRDKSFSVSHFIRKYSFAPGDDFYYGFLLYKGNMAVAHTGAIPFYAFFFLLFLLYLYAFFLLILLHLHLWYHCLNIL